MLPMDTLLAAIRAMDSRQLVTVKQAVDAQLRLHGQIETGLEPADPHGAAPTPEATSR